MPHSGGCEALGAGTLIRGEQPCQLTLLQQFTVQCSAPDMHFSGMQLQVCPLSRPEPLKGLRDYLNGCTRLRLFTHFFSHPIT